MAAKSFAEFYHNETKYSPEGLSKNQRRLDWSKQPSPFKDYLKGNRIELGTLLKKDSEGLTKEEANLKNLSKLLYFTNGVTALVPYSTPLYLRAAPSAGGLYPTEIYVISNGYEGLPDGIYNFQVKSHSLLGFSEGNIYDKLKKACLNNEALENTKLAIVYTGVFNRSEWRYEDRAYRRILLDTGHVMGNSLLYAPFVGFYGNIIGSFNDDYLNDLLLLDKNQEGVLGVMALSEKRGIKPESKAWFSKIKKDEHAKIDMLLSFHNAGKISDPPELSKILPKEVSEKAKFSFTFGEVIEPKTIAWEKSLEETILKRRSTRAFSGESITKDQLSQVLTFAYKPDLYEDQGFDPASEFFDLSLIETYIAVSDVQGIEDGCYYYSASKNELRQIRFKNFRQEIYYLCLGQDLGRDAGAVIFHTVNLPEAVKKYGERAYRYLHLDAGILGQKINLACINTGLGVSGIGGFFDNQVNELLGIPEAEAVLYITTIGKPEV